MQAHCAIRHFCPVRRCAALPLPLPCRCAIAAARERSGGSCAADGAPVDTSRMPQSSQLVRPRGMQQPMSHCVLCSHGDRVLVSRRSSMQSIQSSINEERVLSMREAYDSEHRLRSGIMQRRDGLPRRSNPSGGQFRIDLLQRMAGTHGSSGEELRTTRMPVSATQSTAADRALTPTCMLRSSSSTARSSASSLTPR